MALTSTSSSNGNARTYRQFYRRKPQLARGDVYFVYDPDLSVFQGSVKGTVFAKEEGDVRYDDRHGKTHRGFHSRINFERGDDVLQVRERWDLPAKL
jgi:hypothetical protein